MNMLIPTVAAMKNEETPLHPVIFRTKGAPFPPYHFLKHMIYILCWGKRGREGERKRKTKELQFAPFIRTSAWNVFHLVLSLMEHTVRCVLAVDLF